MRAALEDATQRFESLGAAFDCKERQLQDMTTAADQLEARIKAGHPFKARMSTLCQMQPLLRAYCADAIRVLGCCVLSHVVHISIS